MISASMRSGAALPATGMRNECVTAIVLAGGKGSRMGGIDKGMLEFNGVTLVEQAIARIAPHASEILISANRNLDFYSKLGLKVVSDEGCGPLCGIRHGMSEARCAYVLSLPCDTPFFPEDIAERLMAGLNEADIAIPEAGGKTHQAFMLCKKALVNDLAEFIDGGGRKVREWQSRFKSAIVHFPEGDDFFNINTPEELEAISSGGMRR